MRANVVAMLFLLSTAAAGAQALPPGYTPADVAQQAKLRADVGTWSCLSSPSGTKPLTLAESEQGAWFVTRELGDNPATSYERWSHSLKAYILITIYDSGASNVAQTSSLDPDNATWTQVFPALDMQGRKRLDNPVTRSGNVMRSIAPFYDANGKLQTSTTTCTKG